MTEARIEHVGSTGERGAPTKGALDICVPVDRDRLGDAIEVLGDAFEVHHRCPTYASFTAPAEDGIAVGV